ncbi:6937_t:CDS:2 [Ambispora leptoticha]|uniref:6937_t:CDS:1 n=1 Tax=Ambispora leptoticha TaxID=144679 RepID=A0A9N8V402_9GLOM|nr:6937_t:CDS:2 [Ambispora leptoticha]
MAETRSGKKEIFESTKPHLNIATLGHVDHGKTTLTSAITHVLARENKAKSRKYEEIDAAPEEKARGITIKTAHVEFETDRRHYALVDCPGHADYIKNMITGAAQANGGILVVDASQGGQAQTKEHLLLAKQVGVDKLVIFANKVDLVTDNEMLEIIKEDIKELLKKYKFDENSPIIFGSARKALEENPGPGEPMGHYQKVEILGLGKEKIRTKVIGAEMFGKILKVVKPNYDAALLLQGVKREQVARGMAVVKPGTINIHSKFEAQVYVLTKAEGGRHTTFEDKYSPQFYFHTVDITGIVELPKEVTGEKKVVNPGDNISLKVKLIQPVALEVNNTFSIREGGKTVGKGIITKIIE